MQSPLSYAFSSVLSNKGCLSSLDTALSKNRYPHHSHLASVRERAGQGLQASTSLLHCCQCLQPWTHFGFYFQLCHHQHAGPLGDVPIICANTYTPLLSSLCILNICKTGKRKLKVNEVSHSFGFPSKLFSVSGKI